MLIGTVFGLRIKDPAWFEHRLTLLSAITAPSLLAQQDQDFEWAIFAGRDLAVEVSAALEQILEPFEGRAFVVPRSNGAAARMPALAHERGLADADGYVLTARIDDDDAWHRTTVAAVRARAASWLQDPGGARGFGLTFEDGLEWVMYDMLDVEVLRRAGRTHIHKAAIRPFNHPFTSMSAFVCAKHTDGAGALSSQHSRIPKWMASHGFEVESISTERPMWLYARHKQAGSDIQKSSAGEVQMTLGELAAEFGIDEIRTRRYLSSAGDYAYSAKYVGDHLMRFAKELSELDRQIDQAVDEASLDRLKRQRSKLGEELARVSENVVVPS